MQTEWFCLFGLNIFIVMDAKPTEYRGVRFKSKSEAQLAYMFDNSCFGIDFWIYEPEKFKLSNGYIPDFLVYIKGEIFIVEYKPKEPTETYFWNWLINYVKYPNELGLLSGCMLLFGSIYNGGIYQFSPSGNHLKVYAFDNEVMRKTLEYRFDLK